MAVCLKGLTDAETVALTHAMTESGARLKISGGRHLSVDKHSTGGIGDKTTLILAPIVAAAGLKNPMMAGRGLGHTGGTLDKLESIPGFRVDWDLEHFKKQIEEIGVCIIGQTADICPADRRMYALRDVTGTIDSIPLICASIMSKKIAEGAQALVLDVKFGSGAFMKSLTDARNLAENLKRIGEGAGQKVAALLSNMNEPLGRFIGNSLEVDECLAILKNEPAPANGKAYNDTRELSLRLAAHMIHVAGAAASAEDGYQIAERLLVSGQAFEKFAEMCRHQGGRLEQTKPAARHRRTVTAKESGHLNYLDLEKLGMASVCLGAGRKRSEDRIDPAAGIEALHAQAAAVTAGDPLFELYANDESLFQEAERFLSQSMEITEHALAPQPLIAEILQDKP